ncbi:DNA polymerase I [Caloramator mitchellensis]|uniref:DNA polymerase I n=1 Tax=Caloramator mitchellensis TaxID=908809 RepID=A0A0R3K3H9_CALMK|nr:DNA polymerase I [Caloramator mitchellensis]KRQ88126.1 DNA polymerase I [Caloramator mitchellensis]
MTKKLIIIDSNSLLNRAFYALPPMNTSYGLPTNAVYGFTVMLLKIFEETKPDYIIAAFDKSKLNFRHEKYSEYKAGRQKMPDELYSQLEPVKEILRAFNIGIIELDGYEADDIIGTVAKNYSSKELEIIIFTGDKDSLQLVGENIDVYITKKGISEIEKFDISYFREKYPFEPEGIIEMKALMGDASDNIPGVPGIGEKTALKLLGEFKNVDNIYSNIDKISSKKVKETLISNRELAYLSKELATINVNAPIEIDFEKIKLMEYDSDKVRELLVKYECYSLIDKLTKIKIDKKQEKYISIEIFEEYNIDYIKQEIKTNNKFAFFVIEENNIFKGLLINGNILLKKEDVYKFKDIFEDEKIEKNTYSSKALFNFLKQNGLELKGLNFDAEVAAYILNPSESKYEVKNLLSKYVSLNVADNDKISIAALFLQNIDKIKNQMIDEIEKLNMKDLYYNVELKLIEVLSEMETNGFKIQYATLQELGQELNIEIERLTNEIYELAGEEFNINSPKQLGVILFEKLNLPVVKKTKTGYSTDAEVLEELSSRHEIVEKILHYRQLIKLKTTYIEGLITAICEDGKIHTRFNQTVTATGRISSTEPNLQNIPIKLDMGRRIRKAFVPSSGDNLILSADYSQIELRVLAHLSKDENFIDAFIKGQDVHTRTASEVFGVSIEKVTPLLRSRAKAVNFGIVYGLSDYGLSKDLKISRKEAKTYIENYFARYSGVKKYLDDTIKNAAKNGYVTTILNRIRYIPEIKSTNKTLRALGERLAMNSPVQGSAADIIKIAMIEVYKNLKLNDLKSKLILQVHDELILEVPKNEIDLVANIVKESMENAVKLIVPLAVDVHIGKTWYDAK